MIIHFYRVFADQIKIQHPGIQETNNIAWCAIFVTQASIEMLLGTLKLIREHPSKA
jgi:hypothetical protein